MGTKLMTEQERKRAYEKGDISSGEYSKLVYEESPYKDRAADSDMRNKLNALTNKAGAGRGGQGGPTAKQAEQNTNLKGPMSSAEKSAREEMEFKKLSEPNDSQKYAKGGSVSASRRADGIASKGKTRGKMC
jgi:hypothetical protein